MTAERDISRQYLVPVGPNAPPGEPENTHLAVLSWNTRIEAWLTGLAVCGRSAAQGELDSETTVTCPECLEEKDRWEQILARRNGQPAGDQLRAELRKAQQRAHEADAARAEAEAALLESQAATLRAQAREDRTRAQAVNAHAQVTAVRALCDMTIRDSMRVVAIEEARAYLSAIDSISDRRMWPGDDAWGSVWLHGDWRWLTKNMETPAREYAADCVARWSLALGEVDGDPDRTEPDGLRWWRD